jgi:hypothetical protein
MYFSVLLDFTVKQSSSCSKQLFFIFVGDMHGCSEIYTCPRLINSDEKHYNPLISLASECDEPNLHLQSTCLACQCHPSTLPMHCSTPIGSFFLVPNEELDQPLLQDNPIGCTWDVCKGGQSISFSLWCMVHWQQLSLLVCEFLVKHFLRAENLRKY